jgi:hypothetical protein
LKLNILNRVRGPTAGVPSLLTIHIITGIAEKGQSSAVKHKINEVSKGTTTNLFSYLKALKCVNCRQNRTQQIMLIAV